MKTRTVLMAISAGCCMAVFTVPVFAQDSAFLACGQYSDRGQRIACLEDTLDAALAAREPVSVAPAPGPAARGGAPAVSGTMPAAPMADSTPAVSADDQAEATGSDTSLLERIRSFGSKATTSISSDASGQDQLHDTITGLEKRNDLWTVTLASGQVWRQVVTRFLNLREGDEITIYQAGIGSGFRMATGRLSGFIRVERVK